MTEFSPSGKLVCQSNGPLDAEIVLIGESPAKEEMAEKPFPKPLVGPSGRLLNKALVASGINRDSCYIMNLVPVRPDGDKFANHTPDDLAWGKDRLFAELANLPNAKVLVALGANPTEWLLGGKPPVAQRGESRREGFISAWRGSAIEPYIRPFGPNQVIPEDYMARVQRLPLNAIVLPTFHPAAVLRQFNWHPWFLQDIQKAAEIAKNGLPPKVYRTWHRNDLAALKRLADSNVDLIAVDSELDPWIVGIATEDEVHVFEWEESFRKPLTKILANPRIVKIAHRWLHDHAFFRKCLDIHVQAPLFDLLGGMQNLNSALEKSLSPHAATKFTNWPYHKWLTNVDQLLYCGMDCIVTYDSYWPIMKHLTDRGLYRPAGATEEYVNAGVTNHDHKLLIPLIEMQAKGFKINETVRLEVQQELDKKLFEQEYELKQLVDPIVDKEIKRFQKPHLFRADRKCECCGGGTLQRVHCWKCGPVGTYPAPTNRQEWGTLAAASGKYERKYTIKELQASLPSCLTCQGSGKIVKKLEFNSDSPDQLADVVYRGLHIRPRKFKGVETVKAAQLDPLKDKHPIIAKIVEVSETRADYDTVARLSAGQDGLLHCEFDPWGAETRMASKKGLLEAGTNAQNLPKAARRFVVPRDGFTFLYPDFAQIEARAMAVLSGDKNLRKALYDPIPELGKPDYHTWLLRAIHDYDGHINLSRDQSKRVSYAGFYGARPEQLAKELTAEAFRKKEGMNVDRTAAARILDTLYRVCPEVPRWQKSAVDEVLRTRRLVSPTGREFPFVGYIIDKKDKGELDYEIKKQVWSRLPQDMGSWILGLGLIDIYYTSNEWGRLLTPLIPVHDSVLIECPIKKETEASALAISLLTRYIWGMDFLVDMKKGDNWYAAS